MSLSKCRGLFLNKHADPRLVLTFLKEHMMRTPKLFSMEIENIAKEKGLTHMEQFFGTVKKKKLNQTLYLI